MSLAENGNNLLEGPTLLADPDTGFVTRTEAEIIMLGAEGFEDKEIARLQDKSPRTVINQFVNIKEKLGAFNRMQVVSRSFALGILQERGFAHLQLLVINILVGIAMAVTLFAFDDEAIRPGRARGSRAATRVARARRSSRETWLPSFDQHQNSFEVVVPSGVFEIVTNIEAPQ